MAQIGVTQHFLIRQGQLSNHLDLFRVGEGLHVGVEPKLRLELGLSTRRCGQTFTSESRPTPDSSSRLLLKHEIDVGLTSNKVKLFQLC